MSRFNMDLLCLDCLEDEKNLPGYKTACKAEVEAIKKGNYNFEGIGLPRGSYE